MSRIFILIAAILGGLAVAAGAFGAHALKENLSEKALSIFEIATRYQMYHALALLLVALLLSRSEVYSVALLASGWLFIVGIAIFCGSLYALSLTDVKLLGAVAPLGGAALIAAWGALAIGAGSLKF